MLHQPSPPLRCARCAAPPADARAWRCPCGGPFEYEWQPRFDPARIVTRRWHQARYAAMLLPPESRAPYTALGEGMTPLVPMRDWGGPLAFKLDFLMPTASYKDRGSATLLTVLRSQGVTALVEDSSGNAGASLAAYAAAAGIEATIYVPSHAAAGKKAQIATFGATLREIEGPRQATSDACHEAARRTTYASHAWHPAFLLGQVAAAWELWEQLEGALPDALIVPVGQGGMLLGYYRGFQALQRAGLLGAMPRLVAVQAEGCAPLVAAWTRGDERVAPVAEGETVAVGIRIRQPARGDEMLRALRESDGVALAVPDAAIREAHRRLAQQGLYVEPTSAVPVAALAAVRARLGDSAFLLVPLSGSGLKEG